MHIQQMVYIIKLEGKLKLNAYILPIHGLLRNKK